MIDGASESHVGRCLGEMQSAGDVVVVREYDGREIDPQTGKPKRVRLLGLSDPLAKLRCRALAAHPDNEQKLSHIAIRKRLAKGLTPRQALEAPTNPGGKGTAKRRTG